MAGRAGARRARAPRPCCWRVTRPRRPCDWAREAGCDVMVAATPPRAGSSASCSAASPGTWPPRALRRVSCIPPTTRPDLTGCRGRRARGPRRPRGVVRRTRYAASAVTPSRLSGLLVHVEAAGDACSGPRARGRGVKAGPRCGRSRRTVSVAFMASPGLGGLMWRPSNPPSVSARVARPLGLGEAAVVHQRGEVGHRGDQRDAGHRRGAGGERQHLPHGAAQVGAGPDAGSARRCASPAPGCCAGCPPGRRASAAAPRTARWPAQAPVVGAQRLGVVGRGEPVHEVGDLGRRSRCGSPRPWCGVSSTVSCSSAAWSSAGDVLAPARRAPWPRAPGAPSRACRCPGGSAPPWRARAKASARLQRGALRRVGQRGHEVGPHALDRDGRVEGARARPAPAALDGPPPRRR